MSVDENLTLHQRLVALLGLVDQLIELITLEDSRMQVERPAALSELIQEKARLALELQHKLKELKLDRSQLSRANLDMRQLLLNRLQVVQERVMENGRVLLRRKQISEGLLNAIAAESQKNSLPRPTYNIAGGLKPAALRPPPASIALNAMV